ncbi:hypothetical protein E3P99_02258 [Wallemia hederae]|uniref:Uncharacterized protein n=1 Tax=Wallemia hederae TaxID=1540922 RepID=A0A4T0FKT4_9BASI|nr:hypothetical protein E3P99_02258 [Wallemia hederae]
MGRKKSGNALPEQVTLYDDKNTYKLLLEDLDDCVHKVNKKLRLNGGYDVHFVLTRNGKDIMPIKDEKDFETAKDKSRGFLKFKCRIELSEKDPATPSQSTSMPRVTTTAKKRLSSHPSLSFDHSDPTSPITKQTRRIAQPRSAIINKSIDTFPALEEYFADFVKHRVEEYLASQKSGTDASHAHESQNTITDHPAVENTQNTQNTQDRPQLSAMRSTIIYDSDGSNAPEKPNASGPVSLTPKVSQRLAQVATPSEVDQLQSSPATKLVSGSQTPALQGLQEASDEEIEVDDEPPRQSDREKGHSSPIEQFDDQPESLPPSQIPPSAQPQPQESTEDEHRQQRVDQEGKEMHEQEYENEEEYAEPEKSVDMSQSFDDNQSAVEPQEEPEEDEEEGEQTDEPINTQEASQQVDEDSQIQSSPQTQPSQPTQPSQTQSSFPSTQFTQNASNVETSSQPSPFKRPSLPQDKPSEGQDEELDLSLLFGNPSRGPRQPRRSIQAVLGDEKDDEAKEALMGGDNDDDDEVMTDYESDDTEDHEREMSKLNKSTQGGRRDSSDDNLDNIDAQDDGDDDGDAIDEQEQTPARQAPPVVHSTSHLDPGHRGSPTASERAVSAQVNASMSANQSYAGDTSILDGARSRRSDMSSLGQEILPDNAKEQFLGDSLRNKQQGELQDTNENANQQPNASTTKESDSQPFSSPQKLFSPHKNTQQEQSMEQSQDTVKPDSFVQSQPVFTSPVHPNKQATQSSQPTPSQSQGTVIPDSQPATQDENRPSLKRARDDNSSDEDVNEQNTKRQRMEAKNNGVQVPHNRPRHSEGGIKAPPRKIAMPPRLSINFDDLVKSSSRGPQSGSRSSGSFLPLSEIVKDKTRYAIESPMASPRASPALETRTRPMATRVRTSELDDTSSESESESEKSSSDDEFKKPRRKSVMPAPVRRVAKMDDSLRRASGSAIPAGRRAGAGAGAGNGTPGRVTRSRVKTGGLADM